jgi:regulator of protease activity HflC (stomatin/prohibitin superfamily)
MTQDTAFSPPSSRLAALLLRRLHGGLGVPLLAGVVLVGWCATGVSMVGLDQRVVYERLGAPVAVLHPGLHLIMPWPLSHLRHVEFGTVRQVGLVGSPGLQVLYRVGLTNAQAMDSAYGSSDPGALVQALGSALAVHGGAGALQAALDRTGSGLEVLGVIGLEAVPLPGDAKMAAEIGAETLLAEARSAAEGERIAARREAAAVVAGARAKAAETVASARIVLVAFTADRQANAADSKSFLLERYFANLSRAIAHSPKTIIDHRLNWPVAPELDLRPPPGIAASPGASGVKGN